MHTGFFKAMAQPVAGLTLFALMATSCPSAAMAQLPTIQNLAPAPLKDRPGQQQIAYILGGGDRLLMDVFQVPQYRGEYQRPVDGVLYLPLIGGVSVQNLMLDVATDAVSSAYVRFLKRTLDNIRLLASRPLNIFISRQVNRPSSVIVKLTGGAGNSPGVQHPNLSSAMLSAGRVTLAADISQIQVRRRPSDGSDQVYNVGLRQLLPTGDRTQDLTLRVGCLSARPSLLTRNY
jgi:polysaccharide export outer membrane protein